jgi:hypothetical protein
MKIVDKINELVDSIRKGAVTPSTSDPGNEREPSNSGNPDLVQLSSELVSLLDDGSVVADTRNIKLWSMSKGLPEAEAEQFAEMALSAYMEDEDASIEDDDYEEEGDDMPEDKEYDEDEEDLDEDEDERDEEDEDDDEDEKDEDEVVAKGIDLLSQVSSSIDALSEKVELLAKATVVLLEKANTDSNEVQVLKSELAFLKGTPLNSGKQPVMHKTETEKSRGTTNFKETKELLLKGAIDGKVNLGDLSEFESKQVLVGTAKSFLDSIGK